MRRLLFPAGGRLSFDVEPVRLEIKPEARERIYWNDESCSTPGCKDVTCVCSYCALPIGVSEDDPRWENHEADCMSCDLCRDQVPIIIFRRTGKRLRQAQFHQKCFERIAVLKPDTCKTAETS